MKLYFSLIIVVLFAVACKSDAEQQTVTKDTPPQARVETIQPWSFTIDSLAKKGGGPCQSTNDCMNIRVVWPKVEGGESSIRQILNDSIQQYLLKHLEFGPDVPVSSVSAAVEQLFATYDSYYKENSEYTTGWGMDVEAAINFSDKYACVEILNYSFMGGAHPNYYTQYSNFDLSSGKLISYADFVKDTTAFKAIAEKAFLAEAENKTGEKANIDDFFWTEGFQLASNFKIGKDTIELLYNPYEAAAYVYGEFEIKIPSSSFGDMIEL